MQPLNTFIKLKNIKDSTVYPPSTGFVFDTSDIILVWPIFRGGGSFSQIKNMVEKHLSERLFKFPSLREND